MGECELSDCFTSCFELFKFKMWSSEILSKWRLQIWSLSDETVDHISILQDILKKHKRKWEQNQKAEHSKNQLHTKKDVNGGNEKQNSFTNYYIF